MSGTCVPWESSTLLPRAPGEPVLSSLWLPPAPTPRAMQEQTQGGEQVGRESRGRVAQGHHGNREGRSPVAFPLHSGPRGGRATVPSALHLCSPCPSLSRCPRLAHVSLCLESPLPSLSHPTLPPALPLAGPLPLWTSESDPSSSLHSSTDSLGSLVSISPPGLWFLHLHKVLLLQKY